MDILEIKLVTAQDDGTTKISLNSQLVVDEIKSQFNLFTLTLRVKRKHKLLEEYMTVSETVEEVMKLLKCADTDIIEFIEFIEE